MSSLKELLINSHFECIADESVKVVQVPKSETILQSQVIGFTWGLAQSVLTGSMLNMTKRWGAELDRLNLGQIAT